MVTIYKDENDRLQWDSTYTQLELRGLSTDTKPTTIEGKTIANNINGDTSYCAVDFSY